MSATQQTEEATKKQAKPTEVPLFSIESEKIILSVALDESRKQFASGLLSQLAPQDFYLEQHSTLWRSITTLNDHGLNHDATSVIDFTRKHAQFNGGVEYVMDLADDPIAKATGDEAITKAIKRVKELSTQRQLQAALVSALKLVTQPGQSAEEVLALIEDDLLSLRRSSESNRTGPVHIHTGIAMVLERIERHMDGEQVGTGVTTGSPALDGLLAGGLVDEDLIVLGARPSMGKTASMLNLAIDGAKAGRPALIFSLEMKQVSLTQRLLSREARINGMDLRTGQIKNEDFSRLIDGAESLGKTDIWIDDTPGLTLNEIRSRARTFVATHGKCTIYVDYMQKVGRKPGDDEKTHTSEVSGGLKMLARELKVPVVALSQLNRELEKRANKRPIMSDLRESGAIEQDADVIIFLYRDEVYNPESADAGISEWIVAKQRDGAIGTIKRTFMGSIGAFGDTGFGATNEY